MEHVQGHLFARLPVVADPHGYREHQAIRSLEEPTQRLFIAAGDRLDESDPLRLGDHWLRGVGIQQIPKDRRGSVTRILTGTCRVRGSPLSWPTMSQPLSFGIARSVTMTVGMTRAAWFRAWRPSVAKTTRKPSHSRYWRYISRLSALSSTSRTQGASRGGAVAGRRVRRVDERPTDDDLDGM